MKKGKRILKYESNHCLKNITRILLIVHFHDLMQYKKMVLYIYLPPQQGVCDKVNFVKWSLTGLNSEFSFS